MILRVRRLRSLFSAAALAAAGCTPMQWVKQDATPQQLEQDMAQCREHAWREARLRSWIYRPIGPHLVHDPLGRHYMFYPSSPLGDPFGDPYMEESRLALFCMRSKGYELVPVDEKK
jgi:hypothetical protein